MKLTRIALDNVPESAERLLWQAVIKHAVAEARRKDCKASVLQGAHNARYWLLESPDFLIVACYAGAGNPDALREYIRRKLDAPTERSPKYHPPRSRRRVRLPHGRLPGWMQPLTRRKPKLTNRR